ncbi:serine hydrolase domain-containing protein [Pedobacter steynii]|uniref:Serine hydrolase n=1 Tax=Pedobacter steynii TaxID=430522 RepID=A0A1D7QKH6_9SPHI|nr:serine hydrolase [Pedobacter steynii]AOM79167.1 serine hydrolase [Pedobacter steynii]
MFIRKPKSTYIFLITLFFIIVGLVSCKVARFVYYNFADIGDYKKFPSRSLNNTGQKFSFYQTEKGKFPKNINPDQHGEVPFDQYLEENNTVAFMIIQNDTIQYEKYFQGYNQAAIVPSFSMAKSVTSILIGCAINDGLIKSINEPVTNYIPELRKNGFEKVTLEHLLQMTSGLQFNEGYSNPFGEVATFYYGTNLRKATTELKLKRAPGEAFEYVSGNPQILGLVLERALKTKNITAYLQEKIWQPLGMEYEASWSLDKKNNGLEKTFCCINARARDFAKIGRLYLNKGNWNGQQIVPESWVRQSTKVDTSKGSAWYYQYQWWLPTKNGDFMAAGILGQYIYVNPAKNLIIVRLGKNKGTANWEQTFVNIATGY